MKAAAEYGETLASPFERTILVAQERAQLGEILPACTACRDTHGLSLDQTPGGED